MLSRKDKAATSAEATAQNYNRLSKSYRSSASASIVKLQIGTLLLYLQTPLSQEQQKKCWHVFELKLRKYLNVKDYEVCV